MNLIFNFSKVHLLLLLISSIVVFGCVSPFTIEKTTHKRLIINESSNSEVIKIIVEGVDEGIEFQKIVFNRIESDVSVTDLGNGKYEIASMIQNGGKLVLNKDEKVVDKPNQLTYTINGRESYVQLSNIDFLPTSITGSKK